jgi:flagellar hook-length control protein FliK
LDNRTSALGAVTGGNAVVAGEGTVAAVPATTQGVIQIEEPGASSSANGTLPQPAPATPAEQIKVQLTKGMKDGSDSINVLLHPEDLGTVEVKLQMQDGQVKATITASSAETLQMLKDDSHQLTQSLQNAGFNTDANSLSFQLRGDQQSNSAFAQQQQNNGGSSPSNTSNGISTIDAPTDEQIASATSAARNAAGGLDIKV